MTHIQSEVLKIFKFLVSFLERHNLNYFAAYGTCLGAVRHKGFIPWDDDIDIYMFRDEYNKLLSFKHEIEINGYRLVSIENDEGYYLPFAKIMDTNSTIWEDKDLPFIFGHFVDIFPLDFIRGTEYDILKILKKSNKLWSQYVASISDVSYLDFFKYLFTAHKGKCLRALKHYLYSPSESLSKYKHFITSHQMLGGDKCVFFNPQTESATKVFERKWFEDSMDVQFEDISIKIPKAFDDYLTKCYGQWKVLPPIDMRIATHNNVYYANFKERLSIGDVRERIKIGEHFVN